MRWQRTYRLPSQWKTIAAIDDSRKSNFVFKKGRPGRIAIDRPTKKTLEKRKRKITLPIINFREVT